MLIKQFSSITHGSIVIEFKQWEWVPFLNRSRYLFNRTDLLCWSHTKRNLTGRETLRWCRNWVNGNMHTHHIMITNRKTLFEVILNVKIYPWYWTIFVKWLVVQTMCFILLYLHKFLNIFVIAVSIRRVAALFERIVIMVSIVSLQWNNNTFDFSSRPPIFIHTYTLPN